MVAYQCLDLVLRREFSWHFVVAEVTGLIIGSYVVSINNVLVDIQHRRPIYITKLNVNGASGTYGGHMKVFAGRYYALLHDFLDIIRPANVPRVSTVQHFRTTPKPTVTSRQRWLAPDGLRITKYDFGMLRNGPARCYDCPWASLLHLFPRKRRLETL
jgi:hypothetical protein